MKKVIWNWCTLVLKKNYGVISGTDNLKKWVVKNRLPLSIWIVAYLCSIFILLWFSFCVCVCLYNIYYMIVIFILEIEGYWNNRLAQLPGGAPDTRVTYKVRWFLGSYHVVMSPQEAMPLSRKPWCQQISLTWCWDACCSSKYHCQENYFEDPTETYMAESCSLKVGWVFKIFSLL